MCRRWTNWASKDSNPPPGTAWSGRPACRPRWSRASARRCRKRARTKPCRSSSTPPAATPTSCRPRKPWTRSSRTLPNGGAWSGKPISKSIELRARHLQQPARERRDPAAYVEARRSAREAPPQPAPRPAETEQERDNRIVAERLGLTRTPTFGSEKQKGGGIFQLQRVTSDEAEFFFFGWNKAIQRRSRQMIEVRRGNNPTIEIAVVRRMIAIIREYVKEDFTWESQRLHRDVELSARLSDHAGLERFMLQEFFSKDRR